MSFTVHILLERADLRDGRSNPSQKYYISQHHNPSSLNWTIPDAMSANREFDSQLTEALEFASDCSETVTRYMKQLAQRSTEWDAARQKLKDMQTGRTPSTAHSLQQAVTAVECAEGLLNSKKEELKKAEEDLAAARSFMNDLTGQL